MCHARIKEQSVRLDSGYVRLWGSHQSKARCDRSHSLDCFSGDRVSGICFAKGGSLAPLGSDGRLHPDCDLRVRGLDPRMAGEHLARPRGARLLRAMRDQRNLWTAAHDLRRSSRSTSPISAGPYAQFRSRHRRLDRPFSFATCDWQRDGAATLRGFPRIKRPPGIFPGRRFHRRLGEAYPRPGSTKGRTLLSARPSLHWAGAL